MLPARIIRKFSLPVVFAFLSFGDLGAQKLPDSIATYYYTSERDSANTHKIANEYNSAGQKTSWSIYTWDKSHWDGWQFYCEGCSYSPGKYALYF